MRRNALPVIRGQVEKAVKALGLEPVEDGYRNTIGIAKNWHVKLNSKQRELRWKGILGDTPRKY
jgi:hypothetical protein